MPRGGRNKLSKVVSTRAAKRSKQAAVTNVNKSGKETPCQPINNDENFGRKRHLVSTRATQQAEKNCKKAMVDRKTPEKGNKNGRNRRTAATGSKPSPACAANEEIDFIEDDQVVKIQLDQDDEQLYQSDEDTDIDEGLAVSSNSDSDSEESEAEPTGQYRASRLQSPQGNSQGGPVASPDVNKSVKVIQDGRTHRGKIKEINLEMKQRVKELHQIMTEGGLTQASAMLNECFDINTGSAKRARIDKGKPIDDTFLTNTAQLNINDNHTNPENYPASLARSIETIYKNAVEKRTSSSSEEGIDISDDSLDLGSLVEKIATVIQNRDSPAWGK